MALTKIASNGIDDNAITSSKIADLSTIDTTNLEVTNIKAKDGTAAMSIANSTGVVSLTANPVLSGGGITFPATQVASSNVNTLDDYEEGTWTPSLGGTATYTVQSGTYIKIGKMVTINFSITVNQIGTGNINTISGLPFSCAVQGTGLVGYFNNLYQAWGSLGFFTDGTTLRNISLSTGASVQSTDRAIFGNGTRIDGCSITYSV